MALRKPKLRKYPKKPKQTASLEVKERYLQRVKEVDSDNAKRVAEYSAKKSKLQNVSKKLSSGTLFKKRAELQNKLRSL